MDNKTKTLIIGTGVGALIGLAGSFLLTRRAQETGTEIAVSTGDWPAACCGRSGGGKGYKKVS
jgi:gas vesicle protein